MPRLFKEYFGRNQLALVTYFIELTQRELRHKFCRLFIKQLCLDQTEAIK